jgi:peptidyl-prolyl cis-trans isomerase SurA
MHLLLILLILLSVPAFAVDDAHIVAVVNDEAITSDDVKDREGLVFISSGLPQDEATRKNVRERVLKNLIQEKLQLQEAKHNGIDVAKTDLEAALNSVAKQNNIPMEEMDAMMKKANVPRQTLLDQIKATLSWTRVIQRTLRPQVEVGDDEISAVLERIKANEGKPEYLMSEIFLAIDNPADEAKVQTLADSLVARMKEGAPFAVIAQQFSQGTGAINGGDLGWVQSGQLSGELDNALQKLTKGQVSPPIRMADGLHLLGKRDERIISAVDPTAIEVHLRQASLPLLARSMQDAKADIDAFRQTITSCGTLTTRANEFPDWTVADMGVKRMSELPPWLANLAKALPINEPSKAMEKSSYAILLYVCERNDSGTDRSNIMSTLGNEKLDLQARRLLRDLQRSASIEMRE